MLFFKRPLNQPQLKPMEETMHQRRPFLFVVVIPSALTVAQMLWFTRLSRAYLRGTDIALLVAHEGIDRSL